ncbi:MAG: hypothetical protein JXA89_07445, partial [Anaerolineae bacterium]|nr:hypothetical protein [Anaerolineae bacterium]
DFNDTQHWHWRGTCALVEGLRAVLPPDVVIAGENTSELHTHLIPLCCDRIWNGVPELFPALFGSYVKVFEPGYPPVGSPSVWAYDRTRKSTWSKEAFYKNLETIEKAGFVPTLRLNNAVCPVDNQESLAIYEAAGRYQARHAK